MFKKIFLAFLFLLLFCLYTKFSNNNLNNFFNILETNNKQKKNIGEQCFLDNDCLTNKCIINKCTNKDGKFTKDMICTMDEQCEDNLVCRKSNNIMKCKELSYEDEDCFSSEHCEKNLWCSLHNKCTMKRKDGEYCFGYDDACISGRCKNMYCMTNKNGKYYIPEGAPGCVTDKDCMDGLICSNMGYKQLVCQKK